MSRYLSIFLPFLTFLIPWELCFAGGRVSSGGDFLTDEANPWFLGDAPVQYCLQVGTAEQFSLSKEQLRPIVQQALEAWATLIPRLNVRALPSPASGQRALALRFEEEECRESTSLTFFFGQRLESVDPFMTYTPRNKAALTTRIGIDYLHGERARGYVWLNNDVDPYFYVGPTGFDPSGRTRALHEPSRFWSVDNRLFYALLHEIGHTFGLSHDSPFSIMHQDYVADAVAGEFDGGDVRMAPTEALLKGIIAYKYGAVRAAAETRSVVFCGETAEKTSVGSDLPRFNGPLGRVCFQIDKHASEPAVLRLVFDAAGRSRISAKPVLDIVLKSTINANVVDFIRGRYVDGELPVLSDPSLRWTDHTFVALTPHWSVEGLAKESTRERPVIVSFGNNDTMDLEIVVPESDRLYRFIIYGIVTADDRADLFIAE